MYFQIVILRIKFGISFAYHIARLKFFADIEKT